MATSSLSTAQESRVVVCEQCHQNVEKRGTWQMSVIR